MVGVSMNKTKITAITAIIMCTALSVGLLATVSFYSAVIDQKDARIRALEEEVDSSNKAINNLKVELNDSRLEFDKLERNVSALEDQLAAAHNLTEILLGAINGDSAGNLKVIAVHVSYKGPGYAWGNTPNVTYTYNKIRNLTDYEVLVLPEYDGNFNWSKTYAWLSTNFTGIPVILPVFEGGTLGTPTLKLSTDEIAQAMAACSVRMVRLSEIISWHMENNQSFPVEYVRGILSYCKQRGTSVLWQEWKIGEDVFQTLEDCIKGFEDIVIVAHATNTKFDTPIEGFLAVSGRFERWGASIQAWRWYELTGQDLMNMPLEMLVQDAVTAKNMGVELLQFEPSWYFIDNNGEPREQFGTLGVMVL